MPTPADVPRELLAGSADGISFKTARIGFTTSQRTLFLCAGLGVEVVMGNQIDGQSGSKVRITCRVRRNWTPRASSR